MCYSSRLSLHLYNVKNSIIVKSIDYYCFIVGRGCWDHLVLIYYTERKIKGRCLVAMSTIPTKELRYLGLFDLTSTELNTISGISRSSIVAVVVGKVL